MKSTTIASLFLLASAQALPQSSAPDRKTPFSWQYEITALSGPGCPDYGVTEGRYTRPSFGMNSPEIFYWFFAYPHINLSVDKNKPEASTWCETTLSYRESYPRGGNDWERLEPAGDFRLRLHKNGTAMLARYDIEEGVDVKWKFTYYTSEDEELVDEINVKGPYKNGPGDYQYSEGPESSVQWKLPECGTGEITYRTELVVKSNGGAKGTVTSEVTGVNEKGEDQRYGIEQGVSYDWEKCT